MPPVKSFTTNPNNNDDISRRGKNRFWTQIYAAPYWLILFVFLFVFVVIAVDSNIKYRQAWNYIRGNYLGWITDSIVCFTDEVCPVYYENLIGTVDKTGNYLVWFTDTIRCTDARFCISTYSATVPQLDGIVLTLVFAFIAYTLAIIIGLLIGIVRANPPRPPTSRQTILQRLRSFLYIGLYNLLTFYVEFMRGIPAVVFILLGAFVILPALRDSLNEGVLLSLGLPELRIRSIDPITGILSLAMIYSAYLSEIFRAGIQGISKGQVEAARSLGMTYAQTMRLIVVPQAIRAVLPPLGNDFIAIIKDTALLTILGVNDITQLSRKWVGTTFTYPETFLVLSAIYLVLTISGSLLVQWMERVLRRHER